MLDPPRGFTIAARWVFRLADAPHAKTIPDKLMHVGRVKHVAIDEIGRLPFQSEAAHLFTSLISARFERASANITSTGPFGSWGEVCGDVTVAI